MSRLPTPQLSFAFDTRGVDLFRSVCDMDLDRGETERRAVCARGDLLGEDQEPALQSGGGPPGIVRAQARRGSLRWPATSPRSTNLPSTSEPSPMRNSRKLRATTFGSQNLVRNWRGRITFGAET